MPVNKWWYDTKYRLQEIYFEIRNHSCINNNELGYNWIISLDPTRTVIK